MLAGLLLAAALMLPVILGAVLRFGQRGTSQPLVKWFWADSRQQLPALSLALMALLLALAVNVGVGTMVQSFSRTFIAWLDDRLASEVYLNATSDAQGAEIVAWLRQRPEVDAILPAWRTDVTLATLPVEIIGFADHATYRERWPLLEALPSFGILLVIVLGVGRVASGAAEPGDVVSVAYLFTVVAFPVRAIGWVLGELPRSVVGWNRVESVLNERGSMSYGPDTLDGDGPVALDVRDVSFTFADADRDVLKGIDLEVAPGKVVAVVGATGSGKSTLTSLLTRLVDPNDGTISVDGVDIRDLTHDELARAIAVVPQGSFLFDDSVRANVTLGGDHPDEDVWAALRTVQADGFVSALPRGLDSELGERGTTLSGGQRQRLSLARALVRNPRLLVMDDATSAVDPEVEQRILRALAAHTADGEGPTVLVVAYRKATIALADEVVFLDDGVIADRGSHDELIARSSDYRNLVNAYDLAREALS